jgi:hypothetical protein
VREYKKRLTIKAAELITDGPGDIDSSMERMDDEEIIKVHQVKLSIPPIIYNMDDLE